MRMTKQMEQFLFGKAFRGIMHALLEPDIISYDMMFKLFVLIIRYLKQSSYGMMPCFVPSFQLQLLHVYWLRHSSAADLSQHDRYEDLLQGWVFLSLSINLVLPLFDWSHSFTCIIM